MKIRQATKEDIPSIISLWEKSDLLSRPNGRDKPENLVLQMQQPNMCILVAEEDKILVGAVIVTNETRKGWINRLAVDPQFRRKGIAVQLLTAAEELLKENGIHVYSALIEEDNIASRTLFENTGYKHIEGIVYYAKKITPDY